VHKAPTEGGICTRDKIVIFRLPFRGPTDEFKGLRRHGGYDVSWMTPQQFDGRARVIVLPGSGATVRDLVYLKQAGGAEIIRRHLASGGIVLGVCGGYQILGERLLDPAHGQGEQDSIQGLGYIKATTLFGPKMLSCRTQARLLVGTGNGGTIVGEERRSGCTFAGNGANPDGFLTLHAITGRDMHDVQPTACELTAQNLPWAPGQEKVDGYVSKDRQIWGTYLHCICDNEAFLRTFFNSIR
jgi:adenosylcobyric acid synthase